MTETSGKQLWSRIVRNAPSTRNALTGRDALAFRARMSELTAVDFVALWSGSGRLATRAGELLSRSRPEAPVATERLSSEDRMVAALVDV